MTGERESSNGVDPATKPPESSPFDIGDTGESFLPTAAATPDKPRDPITGQFTKAPETLPHPDYLINEAKDLGFSDEEIAGTPSHILGRTLFRFRKQQQQERTDQVTARTLADSTKPKLPEPEPEPDIDLDLKEDDYDPGLVGALKKLAKENRELRKRVEGGEQREWTRDAIGKENKLDEIFSKLNEKYPGVYGATDAKEMAKDSKEWKRRTLAISHAGIDLSKPLPKNVEKLLHDATESLREFAGGTAPAPKGKADDGGLYAAVPSSADWDGAALAAPTHRKGAAEPDGEAKAVRNIERKQREAGYTPASDAEVLNGLPG